MKRSFSYLQPFRSLTLLKGECTEHIHGLCYPASEDSRGVVNNNFPIFNRLHKILLVPQDRKRLLLITILAENLESPIESKGYQSRIVINFDNRVTSQHGGRCRNRRILYTLHFIRFLFGTSCVIYPKFYSIWTTKGYSSPLSKMAVAERVERLEMLTVEWHSA